MLHERLRPGGGTLGISGWGCASETLEPLTYIRASSAEFPPPPPPPGCLGRFRNHAQGVNSG